MKTHNIRSMQGLLILWLTAAILVLTACSHWADSERISDSRGRDHRLAKGKMDHFMGSIRYQQADAGDHFRLGRYFQQRGRHTLAIAEFSRTIQLDPGRADAHNAMGVSYDQLRLFDLAGQCYRHAQILKPDFAAAYNNLGYSYLMRGQPEKAVAPLEKAVSLRDRSTRFRNNLALAYRQTGQVETASAEYKLSGQNQPAQSLDPASIPSMPVDRAEEHHRIEIANGNGVHRMARHIGNYFKQKGFDVHRISNADHFKYPRTRILYSDGRRQVACALSRMLFGPDTACDLIYNGRNHGQIKILMGIDVTGLNDLFSGKLKIQVANGNGVQNLARKLSGFLRTRGFYVVHPVNAEHFGYEFTQIVYPAGQLTNAQFLVRELPENDARRLVEDDRRTDTIHIIIGKDFTL